MSLILFTFSTAVLRQPIETAGSSRNQLGMVCTATK